MRALMVVSLIVVVGCTPSHRAGALPDLGTPAPDAAAPTNDASITTSDAQLGDASAPRACATGEQKTYVLRMMNVGTLNNSSNTIAGFNLDDSVRGECDSSDDPNGVEPDNFTGVDNRFGSDITPILASAISSGDSGLSDLFSGAFNDGTVLIVVAVRGVDDFNNDDCVEVTAFMAQSTSGAPTFEPTEVLTPAAEVPAWAVGEINDGRLDVALNAFTLWFPLSSLPVGLDIATPHMRFDVEPAALSQGLIGGSINVMALAELVAATGLTTVPTALSILSPSADLGWDGTACKDLSVGLQFSATATNATSE